MSTTKDEERELKLEIERRREESRRAFEELSAEEREKLKKLHWMRCAKCGAELKPIDIRGVTVDKCFSCGGIYLDDGELEQLAGRAGWFDNILGVIRR